jgi:hypothetical protein
MKTRQGENTPSRIPKRKHNVKRELDLAQFKYSNNASTAHQLCHRQRDTAGNKAKRERKCAVRRVLHVTTKRDRPKTCSADSTAPTRRQPRRYVLTVRRLGTTLGLDFNILPSSTPAVSIWPASQYPFRSVVYVTTLGLIPATVIESKTALCGKVKCSEPAKTTASGRVSQMEHTNHGSHRP